MKRESESTKMNDGGRNDFENRDLVRFVSYNVLSSSLCSPSWYPKCDPEALDAKNRLPKILSKLEEEVDKGAVIGLQEVSLSWSTTFRAFFKDRGYYFTSTHYGSTWSDFMGVALAFPEKDFDLIEEKITCPPSRVKWARPPKVPKTWTQTLVDVASLLSISSLKNKCCGCCGSSKKKSGFGRKTDMPPLKQAQKRWNRMVSFKLRPKRGAKTAFAVSVYHMPCVYWDQQVMTIHAALCGQAAEIFAGDDLPHVILGDYNFGPGTGPYRLMTQGTLSEDDKDFPSIPAYERWRPVIKRKLKSAYAEHLGKEPEYTNYTLSGAGGGQKFHGTLDYIFYTDDVVDVASVDVMALPAFKEGETELCPNASEPSDHIMIGATLGFGSSRDGGGASKSA